jgi:hypothetical protein
VRSYAQVEEEGTEVEVMAGSRPVLRAGTVGLDFRFDGNILAFEWRAATDSVADLIIISVKSVNGIVVSRGK